MLDSIFQTNLFHLVFFFISVFPLSKSLPSGVNSIPVKNKSRKDSVKDLKRSSVFPNISNISSPQTPISNFNPLFFHQPIFIKQIFLSFLTANTICFTAFAYNAKKFAIVFVFFSYLISKVFLGWLATFLYVFVLDYYPGRL